MKLRFIVAAMIFIGSYFPLSMILLVQNAQLESLRKQCFSIWGVDLFYYTVSFKNPALAGAVFMVCLACVVLTMCALSVAKPKHEITITEASYVPADLINYVLPYIVSFMSIDYQDTGKFVGFLIFLSWMFWITHKSGQIILSPLLIAFGWRLYTVSYKFVGSDREHTGRVLSAVEIQPGGRYRQVAIQDVLIIKLSECGELRLG